MAGSKQINRLAGFASDASALSSIAASPPRVAPLPQRSVLEISGPDAQKFLKGLSCKDVESTDGGYSGFLNPSGRVLHTIFIFPLPQSRYLITHESPSTHPAPLETFLPPFRLRSKVRIRDVSEDWECWAAWGDENGAGPSRTWRMGSGGAAESLWRWEGGVQDIGVGEGEIGCWDLRAGFGRGGMGRQLLIPKGQTPTMASTFDSASTENYHLHRMLLGVPEGPGEIVPGSALPLESCMDVQGGGPCKPVSPMDDQTDRMTSVDFRKGCYLGQELTVRTYHTGATRKRILPIRLFPLDNPPTHLSSILPPSDPSNTGPSVGTGAGTDITYHPPASSASKKPRSAGRILSLHPSVTSVGLGLVRLEMVERTRWAGTVVEWMEGEGGRLLANVGGEEWGVWVGRGEAFGAIMEEVEIEAGTS